MSLYKTDMRPAAAFGHPARSLAVLARCLGISLLALTLANCATAPEKGKSGNKYGVKASPKVIQDGEPVPKGGGYDMVGKPYTVAGKLYVPKEVKGYSATGTASWYGPQFHGRLTANGEVFDRDSVSIAHPTMPLPSYVRVTNTLNGRSIIARANDRGPYHDDRLVDVSEQVATSLGFKHLGTARVRVDYLGRAPMEGDDDGMLLATLSDNWRPAQLGRAFPQKTQIASTAPFAPQTPAPASPAQAAAPAKPVAQVATPAHPPAAPAKGVAAKVMPGQKPAPARFVTQVPGKAVPGKTLAGKPLAGKAVAGKTAPVTQAKTALVKGASPVKPQAAVAGKTIAAKPATPQIKAPATKAVVAQVQAHKPAAKPAAPVKTQAGKPAQKAPEKGKGKTDPHKPQTV